ncbi:MAG: amino acid ABC transporter permease [Actinomycetota bacterium]|nr:amino acid ABC transporter permease [Actinomycetota bacterium]
MAEPSQAAATPPDTRGGTAPLPLGTFGLGAAAVGLVLVGTLAVQIWYALAGGPLTEECRASLTNTATGKPGVGAEGVCHMFQAFRSPAETVILVAGIVLGIVALTLGASTFKKMTSKRMREQSIAGAVLGAQAIVVALAILWFRSGQLLIFIRQFLNFEHLDGYYTRFVTVGAKNTLMLAFGGELGGIVIGLVLAVFMISKRRVVRAPAIGYVNFFRGTPLIWQLLFFYSVFTLGFGVLRGQTFQAALIIFALNTGAYAAEVFRAGIQSIERGQMEAARSLGMTYGQAMRYAIVPQAVRRVIPPLMNEFVVLIKDTALVAVLGLTLSELDIFSLSREVRSTTLNGTSLVAAAIAYLVITLPLIAVVNQVERRLRSGLTGVIGL